MPFVQAIYDQGHRGEDVVVDMLAKHGWEVSARQDEVTLPVGKTAALVGHIDGEAYCAKVGDKRLVEIKCLSETSVKRWGKDGWDAFPSYAWQLSAMMHAGGWPTAILAIGRKNSDGNVAGVDIVLVGEPPVPLADIKRRVLAVERAALGGAGEEPECDRPQTPFCPYVFEHVEDVNEGDVRLEELGYMWLWGKAVETQGKQLRQDVSAQLGDWFDSRGLKGQRAETGLLAVNDVVSVKRGGLDQPRLSEELGVDLREWQKPDVHVRYQKVAVKEP